MTRHSHSKNPLYARFVQLRHINIKHVREMYLVFQAHYEHTDVDTFMSDLSMKDGAMLLIERDTDRIVGFSTVVTMAINTTGATGGTGIFSGDTIIEPQYWGSRVLHIAFLKYIILQKLRRPFKPTFWLLISKGYKTYLLMANNFDRYYPHPDNRYPEMESLVRNYCDVLFPGYYDDTSNLLDFGESAQCLKSGIAGVTEELARQESKIRFFQQCNPSWSRGTELPCIGLLSYTMLLKTFIKWTMQSSGRSLGKSLGKVGGRLKLLGAK
ncbi:hypothetical protein [uncultured Marinobacter sp.]|uniref:hypothetical protein n=1 Tax=uncultured Marinobacter sp. TaxID=187379 RepID=UPI0030DB503A